MFEIRMEGLDDLSRELREAQEALKSLHGELGEVRFDPDNPADVQRAIVEMKKLVDQRVAHFSQNALVAKIAASFKETVEADLFSRSRARQVLHNRSARRVKSVSTESGDSMTVSEEDRLENIDTALRILMGELGEESIIMVLFKRPNPEYEGILPTTWDELEEAGWIITDVTTMGGNIIFRLTGSGWIEGLSRTGQLDSAIARLPQLCQVAKDRVKSRQQITVMLKT